MNAPVTNLQPAAPLARTITAMQVIVKGRVQGSRLHNGTRYTQIMTPAKDSYSRPQVIEVRSKRALGMKDEEVVITAELGGYTRKAFISIDKETGERLSVTPVDMTLDAVE